MNVGCDGCRFCVVGERLLCEVGVVVVGDSGVYV